MSQQEFKDAMANGKLICPKCKKSILKFEKYAETIDSVRDGFNIQEIDSHGARVTLICGNDPCTFKERTDYWIEYTD